MSHHCGSGCSSGQHLGPAAASRELFVRQGNHGLDQLLERFVLEGHPEIYDCRACPQDQDHCPQDMIVHGQANRIWAAVNGCSDSRAHPSVILKPKPGDMFVTTGAGALLTSHKSVSGTTHTWGSIEYAVDHLGVNTLVQFGHTDCGAMAALLKMSEDTNCIRSRHLGPMLREVAGLKHGAHREFVKQYHREPTPTEMLRALEIHNTRVSTQHMQEFVDRHYSDRNIQVHGWLYDMKGANILALQPDGSFKPITHMPSRVDYASGLPTSCSQGVREIGERLQYPPENRQSVVRFHGRSDRGAHATAMSPA